MHSTFFTFSAGADCTCKQDQTKSPQGTIAETSDSLEFLCPPCNHMLRLFHAHHSLEFLLFIIIKINLIPRSTDKSKNIPRLCNLWGHNNIEHVSNRASVGLPWAPSRRYHLHLLNPDQSSTAPWRGPLGSAGTAGTGISGISARWGSCVGTKKNR